VDAELSGQLSSGECVELGESSKSCRPAAIERNEETWGTADRGLQ
jgi:hypothetical protein